MINPSLAVFAILKDEGHIIREWIGHYIAQGVDHFHLIDNGSSDNFLHLIEDYRDRVFVYHDYVPHRQREHYNDYFLPVANQYDWCLCCDLDEFMYARKGFRTIKDVLRSVERDVGYISVPWKMFGSTGYIKQPSSARSSFVNRANHDHRTQGMIEEGMILCKTIFRGGQISQFECHSHAAGGRALDSRLQELNAHQDNRFIEISERLLDESVLHLNHYAIQSYHWFMSVKSIRGDAYGSGADHTRNSQYFSQYDYADVVDYELANKVSIP
jgi:hypothetical protein